jgi:hypothetical protein
VVYQTGQTVMVDMSGFSHGGVSFGGGVQVAGVIMGANPDGTYKVRLGATISGVNQVTVGQGRLRPA